VPRNIECFFVIGKNQQELLQAGEFVPNNFAIFVLHTVLCCYVRKATVENARHIADSGNLLSNNNDRLKNQPKSQSKLASNTANQFSCSKYPFQLELNEANDYPTTDYSNRPFLNYL